MNKMNICIGLCLLLTHIASASIYEMSHGSTREKNILMYGDQHDTAWNDIAHQHLDTVYSDLVSNSEHADDTIIYYERPTAPDSDGLLTYLPRYVPNSFTIADIEMRHTALKAMSLLNTEGAAYVAMGDVTMNDVLDEHTTIHEAASENAISSLTHVTSELKASQENRRTLCTHLEHNHIPRIQSLTQYAQNAPQEQRNAVCRLIMAMTTPVFNVHALNSIYTAEKQNVLMFVGTAHCRSITTAVCDIPEYTQKQWKINIDKNATLCPLHTDDVRPFACIVAHYSLREKALRSMPCTIA